MFPAPLFSTVFAVPVDFLWIACGCSVDKLSQKPLLLFWASVLLMMLLMLPFFLLAMFERHGQPLEVLIRHFIQARFVRPRIRVWQNDNFYQTIERSIRNQQEVQKILRGKQRKNQADKG